MNLISDSKLLSNQSFSVMFSKVLYVTVLLYLYSYLFSSPRISFLSKSFLSSCRKDQFAVLTF